MPFLKKKHKTSKVRNKIMSIFILAAVLPILLIGSISILQIRKQMREHYDKQLAAEGQRVNSVLFDITTSIYTSTETLITTRQCMHLFGAMDRIPETDNDYAEFTAAVARLKNNTAAISAITVYTNNPNLPENNYIHYRYSCETQPWYSILPDKGYNHWGCFTSTRFRQDYYELTLVRRIGTVSSKYSAYLVVQLDNNNIKNRLDQNSYTIISTINNFPVFYSSRESLKQTEFPFPGKYSQDFFSYDGPMKIDSKTQLSRVVSFRPYGTRDLFYICVSAADAYDSIHLMTLAYCLVIAISILVPMLIVTLFLSAFSNRVTTLKTAMHQASEGDYNIIEVFRGDDELSDVFSDLKRTVELIRRKEAEIYTAQINEQLLINQQQQMEFKMLASQINPHFLYNTLETIRMQSLSAGNRDVAHSIKLLGKAMHYVLENSGINSTTLDRELSYIATYLEIQKLRFGDRFTSKLELEEGLDPASYQILPLLLQPVVENAVVHGLESVSSNGCVKIQISVKNDILQIVVGDNGCGMDEESLSALKYKISHHDPADSRSIGLYNISQRIKLCYGSTYGMEIDSIKGEGTMVTISLPAQNIHEE